MKHTVQYDQAWLKMSDAAKILNVTTNYVRTLIKEGKLKAFRLGGPRSAIRITQADLDDFIVRASRIRPHVDSR